MLTVTNLTFAYNRTENPILLDISFSLEKGQILTVLGPNGAGKSTLLNCIAGSLVPKKGSICIGNKDIRSLTPRQIACNIGYVRQSINTDITFSVREFVRMGTTPHMSALERPSKELLNKADRILEQMDLELLAESPLNELSGGERQRAMIGQVLVQDPQIILFDEPTAHLDFGNQLKVLQRIADLADRGYTIIMTTHDPEQAILLDDTAGVLEKNGKFTIGPTRKVLTGDFLTLVYQTDLKLIHLPEQNRLVCLCPPIKRKAGTHEH